MTVERFEDTATEDEMEARRAETAKLALFTTDRPEGNVLRI